MKTQTLVSKKATMESNDNVEYWTSYKSLEWMNFSFLVCIQILKCLEHKEGAKLNISYWNRLDINTHQEVAAVGKVFSYHINPWWQESFFILQNRRKYTLHMTCVQTFEKGD